MYSSLHVPVKVHVFYFSQIILERPPPYNSVLYMQNKDFRITPFIFDPLPINIQLKIILAQNIILIDN